MTIARWRVEGVGVPGFKQPSTFQKLALAELERGRLLSERSRDLVTDAAEGFLRQCTTRAGVAWAARRRPELVMKTENSWGMYTLEMIRRLSVDGSRRAVHQCVVCRTPVVLPRAPREGDVTYCTAAECRREKERRRKAAQRAARRAAP